MSVWFAVPSIRQAAEATACFDLWRKMGYRVAVLRQGEPIEADMLIHTDQYLGWPTSVNHLVRRILAEDLDAEWIVTGGDDYKPDLCHEAEEIADLCWQRCIAVNGWRPGVTFGVMQPTGDRWRDHQGVIIERIAGSPWMGRDFCKRMYGGRGPLYDGYHHNFADEELQLVAQRLGCFWQRPDIIHYHDHWARPRNSADDMPEWYAPITERWSREKALFQERKAAGFPGHEPI